MNIFLIFLITVCPAFLVAIGKKQRLYEAWLVVETLGSQINIKACCKNNSSEDTEILIKLIVEKSDMAGKSKSSQSFAVFLKPGEGRCVSEVRINSLDKYEYQIKLEAYKNGKLIAEDFLYKKR